jgi:hypothetical protein
MGRSLTVSGRGVLLFSVFLLGCASGAEWKQVQVAPTYQAPKTLKVAVSLQTQTQNSAEALAQLQGFLVERLASRGITATIVAAPTESSDANVTIAEWNQGSRALRWLGFGGKGTVVVLVKSPSADGQGNLEGNASGWVRGGWFGGSSYKATQEAGYLIADAIASGKAVAEK